MPFDSWSHSYMDPRFVQMVQNYMYTQVQPKPVVLPDVLPDEGTMLNNFRVGCDPEFMMLDAAGNTIPASLHFPQHGEIGYDHGGRVAEFRPSPHKSVYSIIKQIQALVKDPRVVNAKRRLRAGAICNQDCLGGHVHFGFNAFEKKPILSSLDGTGQYNEKGLKAVKALDALTKTLEHLDILPKSESNHRRASSQGQANRYGAFGDVRDCQGHMEYRTMASWLFDPRVAFLCLTAAKLAAADPDETTEILKGCESFKTFRNWFDQYKGKDANASRASEKLLEGGLSHLQVDPSVDFRERWENLGL